MTGLPELEMSEEKAQRFAAAYHEFRRHFPVPSVDPKWVALATMGYVAFDTYAPAVRALAARKRGGAAEHPVMPAMPQAGAAPAQPAGLPSTEDWFAAPGGPPN